MAKVTVTFTDCDDGSVNIKASSNPDFPGPANEQSLTPAQLWSVELLRRIQVFTESDERSQ